MTRARLLVAAALCVLPLGSARSGAGGAPYAGQATVRLLAVAAAVGFALCAVQARTAALLRVARLAWLSAAAAALVAVGHGSVRVVLCLAVALALTGPAVAASRPQLVRFGERTRRRVK